MTTEQCENAGKNPTCPYLVDITKTSESVEWLKRGYWVQTAFSAGSFFSVVGLIVWVLTGHRVM